MSISKSKRSNNDDKERQNNLQRTLELIEYFSSVKKIINDKEGNKLRELKKIYGQDKKKKKTILKQFKRDRDFLQELGIDVNLNLSKKIKSEDLVLNEGEKKKIAKGILYQIQNTNNKAYRDKLISLYYKLFFSELRFIKKLLKIIKNYNESDLNQLRLLTKSNHNNHNTTPLIELFRLISRKKPIKIIYRKKNGDIISRVIYPLIIYKNLRIFYLISWDYEKSEIRNFIYSNILSYEAISNPSYLKVEIVGDPNEPNTSNKIFVPIRDIYRNLPHPFFISNEKNPMRIKITIKSYYKDLFLDQITLPFTFPNYNYPTYRIIGKSEKEKTITMDVKIFNTEGFFRFISKYPDMVVNIEQSDIFDSYKKYLEETIEFYNSLERELSSYGK